jgi:hypothetical protein
MFRLNPSHFRSGVHDIANSQREILAELAAGV